MKRLITLIIVVVMSTPSSVSASEWLNWVFSPRGRGCSSGYVYGSGYGRSSYGYYNDTAQIISASSNGVANVLSTINDAKKWETVRNAQAQKQSQIEAENQRIAIENYKLQRKNQVFKQKMEEKKAREIQALSRRLEKIENQNRALQEKLAEVKQESQAKQVEVQETSAENQKLQERIKELDKKLNELQEKKELQKQIDDLEKKIEQLESPADHSSAGSTTPRDEH